MAFEFPKLTRNLEIKKIQALTETVSWKYWKWLLGSWSTLKRINIEMCSACNLNCRYCSLKYTPVRSRYLDINIFRKLLGEICVSPVRLEQLALYNSGESLLHPQFFDFLDLVSEYKRRFQNFDPEVFLYTNGMLLNPPKSDKILDGGVLQRLIFSIDGCDKHSFERMRAGANYETVMDNLEYFLSKNNGRVNVDILNLVDDECADLPMDSRMKRNFSQVRNVSSKFPSNLDGSMNIDYFHNDGSRSQGFCWYVFNIAVLTVSGKIGMCCVDLNEKTAYGDFTVSSFKEIYFGKERRKRMKNMKRNRRDLITSCKKCPVTDSLVNLWGIPKKK